MLLLLNPLGTVLLTSLYFDIFIGVFNPNIFNLSLPVDRIIPQNNSNFLNQQTRQSNLGGVFQDQQGRIKRNTIIRELENLGINDNNEGQNNKNDQMNSSKYHFHEEK